MATQAEVDALRAAIVKLATGGAQQVQLGTRQVTFINLKSLRAELRAMEAELAAEDAAASGAIPGVTVAVFDRR